MNLILLGAPGAGKGTQAEILSRKLNVPTISTGNILREAMKNGTPLGQKVKEFMDSGRLVPDDVVIGIIEERLSRADCARGYILDGMPRTLPQAAALMERGIEIDAAISIEVSDDVIEGRMTGRRVCGTCGATYHITANPPRTENICDKCGEALYVRVDDAAETVKTRLATFHKETEPLKEFYSKKGLLITVEGQEEVADTTALVFKALEAVEA